MDFSYLTLKDLVLIWALVSVLSMILGYFWVSSLRKEVRRFKEKLFEQSCALAISTLRAIFYLACIQVAVLWFLKHPH